jgi:hypothetical protein
MAFWPYLITFWLVGFLILTTVVMKNTILWDIMPVPLAFMLVSFLASSTLKIEVIYSSETSVGFQRTARRYIPEDVLLTPDLFHIQINQFPWNAWNLSMRIPHVLLCLIFSNSSGHWKWQYSVIFAGFEVFIAITVKSMVLWVMTLYSSERAGHFRGTYYLRL